MRRTRWMVVGAVLLVGVVACGVSVREAGNQALVDAASGSWDCTGSSGGGALAIGDDGTFRAGLDDDAAGTWKVVDRDLELRVDETLVKILDFDGLSLDVGTITIEFPYSGSKPEAHQGEVELHEFSVEIVGRDRATITPVGALATKRWPSAPFSCTRD